MRSYGYERSGCQAELRSRRQSTYSPSLHPLTPEAPLILQTTAKASTGHRPTWGQACVPLKNYFRPGLPYPAQRDFTLSPMRLSCRFSTHLPSACSRPSKRQWRVMISLLWSLSSQLTKLIPPASRKGQSPNIHIPRHTPSPHWRIQGPSARSWEAAVGAGGLSPLCLPCRRLVSQGSESIFSHFSQKGIIGCWVQRGVGSIRNV